MRVTRISGLPIEAEDIPKYEAELQAGMDAITKDMGRFEKLDQIKKGEFGKRFEEMKREVCARYKFVDDWDFETTIKSKSKLKELCNRYGVIAFSRGSEDKKLQCFIVDSKF